jgi:hypothetical protein
MTADNGGRGCGQKLVRGSARYFCGREIVVELRWRVIVRGVSAKTAGLGHCIAPYARQQRNLDTAAVRVAETVMRGLQTTERHPVERFSGDGDREVGLRRMQRCSPTLIAWSN